METIDVSNSAWILFCRHGTQEELQPDTLHSGPQGQIYCKLQNGHRAVFLSAALQAITAFVENETSVRIGAKLWPVRLG